MPAARPETFKTEELLAGVIAGLPRATAEQMVAQLLVGSAKLLAERGDPAALRAMGADARHLDGGIEAWRGAGQAVVQLGEAAS